MRWRWSYTFGLAALVCLGVGIWWDNGGQAWAATFTGTDYCVNLPLKYQDVCKHYGFWSGFGSVIPWSLFTLSGVFAGLAVGLRQLNCHVPGCPRLGRFPLAGGQFKVCGHHHPGWDGNHPPSKSFIIECHDLWHKAVHVPARRHPRQKAP